MSLVILSTDGLFKSCAKIHFVAVEMRFSPNFTEISGNRKRFGAFGGIRILAFVSRRFQTSLWIPPLFFPAKCGGEVSKPTWAQLVRSLRS